LSRKVLKYVNGAFGRGIWISTDGSGYSGVTTLAIHMVRDTDMHIKVHEDKWRIIHSGRVVLQSFDTEEEAYSWANRNIDDQVFDNENTFADPLEYDKNLVVKPINMVFPKEDEINDELQQGS
jgi:hypothetical protein